MRNYHDVELVRKGKKWRLKNHVFDVALDWADGLEACEVCSTMLSSYSPIRSFEQREQYKQMFSETVVVNCPNNPKKGKSNNGNKSKIEKGKPKAEATGRNAKHVSAKSRRKPG